MRTLGKDGLHLLKGYLATPHGKEPWPGVIVLHDIFGLPATVFEVNLFGATAPVQQLAEDLAEAIAFLVSPRASYITGDNLFVGGGFGSLAAQ